MTKVITKEITKEITKNIIKTFSKTSIKAFTFSLLFLISSVGGSVLINPAGASPNSMAAPAAATPLSPAEANWAASNGNQFNQNYNPQNLINSSNAQYLGISWLFPLPSVPTPLLSQAQALPGTIAPLIINGTIYAVTQANQLYALNAANGNVLWNIVIPILPNSTAGLSLGAVTVHMHDGDQQFTTKLFNHTPTWWISADNYKVYAINALNGSIILNWQIFNGPGTIAGNSPTSVYHGLGATNILIDQNKGIALT